MAPECIEQRSISFKADIFSLGVIIIEIITGRRDYPNVGEKTKTSRKHYTDEVRLFSIIPYCNFLPYLCKCLFMINYLCKCLGGWKLEEKTRTNTHAYVIGNAYPSSGTMHLYSPEVPGT